MDLNALERIADLKERGILTEEEFLKEKQKILNDSHILKSSFNSLGTKTIVKTRVTFVFNGYGDLTLTDVALIWNKSATSFLAFGIGNTLTDNHFMLPLNDISQINTYSYLRGGGLIVISKTGKEYKFAFKHKKDFKIVYDYLQNHIINRK